MTCLLPKRGFTLVETMVAIAVLAIALVGPFVAVSNALNASYIARDQLAASSLAQEGVEYIRSIRDNNYLNHRTWMDELSGYSCYGSSPSGYCVVDPSQGDIHTDSGLAPAMTGYSSLNSVPVLYLSSNALYNQQGSGSPTRFKRTVQIRVLGGAGNEVQVTVLVSWTAAHQSYSVTVTDTLRDWL